ncbi:MAG: hypothetical protein WBX25_14645 [Rhodomicrobium sp.]
MRLDFSFRYLIYGLFAVLFLTGAAWFIADGLKDSSNGEMWQAVSANLLMLHGGAAMMALMALGALIPVHLLRAWRAKKNRVTGTVIASLNGMLIVTAFGLYYLGSEVLRPWMSGIHLAIGSALPVLLGVHIYWGRRTAVTRSPKASLAKVPVKLA